MGDLLDRILGFIGLGDGSAYDEEIGAIGDGFCGCGCPEMLMARREMGAHAWRYDEGVGVGFADPFDGCSGGDKAITPFLEQSVGSSEQFVFEERFRKEGFFPVHHKGEVVSAEGG